MTYFLVILTLILAIFGWFKTEQTHKRISIIVVALLVVLAAVQCYVSWTDGKHFSDLSAQNDTLLLQNENLLSQNQSLIEEISDYQESLDAYSTDVETVKTFSSMSQFDVFGKDLPVGAGLSYHTGISVLMDSVYVPFGTGVRCDCTNTSIDRLRRVIDEYPTYPFSHYWMAYCLREKGEVGWQEIAERAKSILERTTSIAGHHSSHDQALSNVSGWLSVSD